MARQKAELKALLSDRSWRYSNLYHIQNERGEDVLFTPNWVQWQLDDHLWTRNIVPKSRQHGITTWACIRALDSALFSKNFAAGIVADTRENASKIFRKKIIYAYERLPDWLKEQVTITRQDMNGEIVFSNGSSITVSTSHRGGTLQFLHVSEYGPMCAKYPQRADEVKTGALNTIQPDCIAVIESTGHGEYNDFALKAKAAQIRDRQVQAGTTKLSTLDYRFHFFAWWMDPKNVLDPDGIRLTDTDELYFERIESDMRTELSAPQRAWYVKKREEQGDKMLREHPSTPDEVFQGSTEGSYFGSLLVKADKEGRICDLPIAPGIPVNTFWDIGRGDGCGIWFHQQVGPWHNFIDYYEEEGEYIAHYVRMLKEKGYMYGKHYLPHDGEVGDFFNTDAKTRDQVLEGLGVKPVFIVPRIQNVNDGIDMVRGMLPLCRFDRTRCGENPVGSGRGGLPALRSYRKKFLELTQTYTLEPVHDWASRGADAFRQFAQGYKSPEVRPAGSAARRRAAPNWRTA